jgi:hypothetical protein
MAKIVRWVASVLLAVVLVPVVGEFFVKQAEKSGVYDKPGEAVSRVWLYLVSFADLPYFRVAVAAMTGLVLGLWMDWLMRRFDGSRDDNLRALGRDIESLGDKVVSAQRFDPSGWPNNIGYVLPELMSLLAKVEKHGFSVPQEDLMKRQNAGLLAGYLMMVGKFLAEGQFEEARKAAEQFSSTDQSQA